MMRGCHLAVCVLDTFQVAANGELANWSTGAPGAIPVMGGAMVLAIDSKFVYIMTNLQTKQCESTLVDACTYSLPGANCVICKYSDHTILDVKDPCFAVNELVGSIAVESRADLTGLNFLSYTAVDNDATMRNEAANVRHRP